MSTDGVVEFGKNGEGPAEFTMPARSRPAAVPPLHFVRDDSLGKLTYVADVPWESNGGKEKTLQIREIGKK